MTPIPSFPYLTSSLRIAPSEEVGFARGLAIESLNRKPGNSHQPNGLHERPLPPTGRENGLARILKTVLRWRR